MSNLVVVHFSIRTSLAAEGGVFRSRAAAAETEMLTCASDIPRMFQLTSVLLLNLVLFFGSKANQS